MEVTVSRKAHFNAAHRLHNKEWSEKKNSQVFGKCNYPNYHGHNYELIVSVTGKINPDTCLLYTSPSPRDPKTSRMPSSA